MMKVLYSGCYDQHVVSHLFAFMFNLNMISHIRQSKTNKYCKERLT